MSKRKSKKRSKPVTDGTFTYTLKFEPAPAKGETRSEWDFTETEPKVYLPIHLYLAGPDVFVPSPRKHGERLKAIVAKYGMVGLFPMDNELAGLKADDHDSGMKIYREDVRLMEKADAIVANMSPFRGPSMDVGTAFEMGYMAAKGKPCFAYTYDGRSYGDKVREQMFTEKDAEGLTRDGKQNVVEDFGMTDNLMMVGYATAPEVSTEQIYASFEYAVRAAAQYFKKIGRLP